MSNKIIDIFIRTCRRDFYLLNYCLHSIKKFVSGYRNIILNIREKDYNDLLIQIDVTNCVVVKSYNFEDNIDYCGQQICKLQADIWSDAEYIYYIDTDCIFYNNINIEEKYFDSNNNIILFKEYWGKLHPEVLKWRISLKKLNLLTDFETMRRLPQVYPASILPKIREHIVKKTGMDFVNACLYIHKLYKFSEFNIIGSYIILNNYNGINMLLYDHSLNQIPIIQFWSRTKNKNELINQIKKILGL